MVSLPAATRRGDRWFDGIIGKNTLQILMFLKNNYSFSFCYFLIIPGTMQLYSTVNNVLNK